MRKSEEGTLVVRDLIPLILKNAALSAYQSERKRSISLALDETVNQLNDCRSFGESVGLSVINDSTHATGLLFDRQSLLRSSSNGIAEKTKKDQRESHT